MALVFKLCFRFRSIRFSIPIQLTDKSFAQSWELSEDVDEDLATLVPDDYKEGDNKFNDKIGKTVLNVVAAPALVEKEGDSQEA